MNEQISVSKGDRSDRDDRDEEQRAERIEDQIEINDHRDGQILRRDDRQEKRTGEEKQKAEKRQIRETKASFDPGRGENEGEQRIDRRTDD